MTRLPDGWVKRWPTGYLGPAGQVVTRLGKVWVVYWPDGRTTPCDTLARAVVAE